MSRADDSFTARICGSRIAVAQPAWLYAGHLSHPFQLPKHMRLKSYVRQSGNTAKIILDHVIRRPNALSAELKG